MGFVKKLWITIALILFLTGSLETAGATPAQWSIGDGGNGHYYEVVFVPASISWTDANTAAATSIYNNMQGYLSSVTSAGENIFIATLFTDIDWVDNGTNGYMGPWIGGYQPDGVNWTWITGENWGYTAWETNQPTNQSNQDYIHYYVTGRSNNPLNEPATWNDLADVPDSVYGYVIEYEPVPLPGALILFGSGIAGLVGMRRKKYTG